MPWNAIVVWMYLALLALAEVSVTLANPLLVFPAHGGIVLLASVHLALLEGRTDREVTRPGLVPFLFVLILIALIRIISLTLPLAAMEPVYRYVLAGIPMIIGAFLVTRASRYSLRDVGFVWRMWRTQVAVIVVSIGLGFVEYAILKPAPLGPLPWTAGGVLPAVLVGLLTGFPEEFIFRGLLQTATRPILGTTNWIYAATVFAVLHFGYMNPLDLVFVYGVGLLYGWVFERSRSIIGISIGHGQANVILFFVAPNLPLIVSYFGG